VSFLVPNNVNLHGRNGDTMTNINNINNINATKVTNVTGFEFSKYAWLECVHGLVSYGNDSDCHSGVSDALIW